MMEKYPLSTHIHRMEVVKITERYKRIGYEIRHQDVVIASLLMSDSARFHESWGAGCFKKTDLGIELIDMHRRGDAQTFPVGDFTPIDARLCWVDNPEYTGVDDGSPSRCLAVIVDTEEGMSIAIYIWIFLDDIYDIELRRGHNDYHESLYAHRYTALVNGATITDEIGQ